MDKLNLQFKIAKPINNTREHWKINVAAKAKRPAYTHIEQMVTLGVLDMFVFLIITEQHEIHLN